MSIDAHAGHEPIRHRRVPDRIVADKVVLARPGADEAVVLAGAAAAVWVELDEWTTREDLAGVLAHQHEALAGERAAAIVREALALLDDEGLLERRGP